MATQKIGATQTDLSTQSVLAEDIAGASHTEAERADGPPGARPEAVLYSFRRCPYAIRARLALAAAGIRPGVDLELREVSLRAKPPELLTLSPKGTVPVLALRGDGAGLAGGGSGLAEALPSFPLPWNAAGLRGAGPGLPVLDESLAIMGWALGQRDPQGWIQGRTEAEQERIAALIAENDGPFKRHLDRFKYAGHHREAGLQEPERHRREALAILRRWNRELSSGGWLLGERPSLADMALLPFVRQFRLADPEGFDAEADLEGLQDWLRRFLASEALTAVMEAPWAHRTAWRSPGWLYHLTLRQEWQAARREGLYRRSTRGRSLQEVGFVHLSHSHQVTATARRFYGDIPDGDLLLLTIDPQRLQEDGADVRLEPAPDSGELFPHLYGPLPLQAVLLAQPLPREVRLPAERHG